MPVGRGPASTDGLNGLANPWTYVIMASMKAIRCRPFDPRTVFCSPGPGGYFRGGPAGGGRKHQQQITVLGARIRYRLRTGDLQRPASNQVGKKPAKVRLSRVFCV